jgi:hypothetical protein
MTIRTNSLDRVSHAAGARGRSRGCGAYTRGVLKGALPAARQTLEMWFLETCFCWCYMQQPRVPWPAALGKSFRVLQVVAPGPRKVLLLGQ